MPKISRGGVSNRLVDPDFIAAPGTPVETALDQGLEDVGQASKDQESKQDSKDRAQPAKAVKPRGAADTTGDSGQRDDGSKPGTSVTDPDNTTDHNHDADAETDSRSQPTTGPKVSGKTAPATAAKPLKSTTPKAR